VTNETTDAVAILESKIVVPQHVVYRSFPAETVVLNLKTGRYHGLNATAGAMLDELGRADCARDATITLAERFGQPPEMVEGDLIELCAALLERGLIEADVRPGN
jgi:hypothetical protein